MAQDNEKGKFDIQEEMESLVLKLEHLCGKFEKINCNCNKDTFIAYASAQELKEALDDYIQAFTMFQTICEKEGLVLDSNINTMREKVKKYLAEKDSEKIKELACTFFKLTTTAEAVIDELNMSKTELSGILQLQGNELMDKIHPFVAVVNFLINVNKEIIDDEYDAIEEKFSKAFFRALYQGKISIDEEADIKQYGEQPAEEKKKDDIGEEVPGCTGQEMKNTKQTVEKVETAASVIQGLVDNKGKVPEGEAVVPLFEHYNGYITCKPLEIEAEPSASSLQVKRFRSDIIKKGNPKCSFKVMEMVARRKVVSLSDINLITLKDYAEFLYRRGYLQKINSDTSKGNYKAYTLSPAGYDSFYKEISNKGYKIFCEDFGSIKPMDPGDLSPIGVRRFKDITEMTEKLGHSLEENVIFWSSQESIDMAEGIIGYGEDKSCGIFSTALEPGNEKEALEVIKLRAAYDKFQKLILIVYDKSDIQVLLKYLDLKEEYLSKLYFVCIDNYDNWYDADGNEVESLFKENHNDIASKELQGTEEKDKPSGRINATSNENKADEKEPEKDTDNGGLGKTKENTDAGNEAGATDGADEGCEGDEDESDDDKVSGFKKVAYDAICNKNYGVGMAMLRALSITNPDCTDEYNEFSFAVEDPLRSGDYTFSNLLKVYARESGTDLAYDMLELCSVLRSFFTEDACQESYYLKDIILKLETNICYKYSTELKSLVFELQQSFERIGRGFDRSMLSIFANGEDIENKLEDIKRQAGSLLNSHMEKVNVRVERLSNTRREIFGAGSQMNIILNAVHDNDTSKIEDAKKLIRRFQSRKDERSLCSPDFNKPDMERYIDEIWDRLGANFPRLRSENMKPAAKNNIINRMQDILMVISSWVMLNDSVVKGREYPEASFAMSMRSKIQDKLKKCIDSVNMIPCEDEREKAAISVLLNTLEELNTRLAEGYDYIRYKYFYVDFLRTNRIELTEAYAPYMEEDFHPVTPYNLCERIESHYKSDKQTWPEIVKNIFDPQNEDDGHDYGTARLIIDYIRETQPESSWIKSYNPDVNIEAGLANMARKKSDFIARLEMADNYGWIEENGKIDRIIADMEKREAHYIETENFGFYYRTIEKYMRIVRRDGLKHKKFYEDRLAKLKLSKGDLPIFKEIDRLIKSDMYTVADDYMQQVEKYNRQEAPVSSSLADDNDPFSRFLNNYDVFFQTAIRAAKQPLVAEFNSRHKGEANSRINTGRIILENWPRSDSGTIEDKLKNIFSNMGLKVAHVTRRGRDRFSISFQSADNTRDYPHPIGAFGSIMNRNGLEVFMLYGNKDATTMNTEIRKIMTSNVTKASLIIADTALSLIDRRKLAQKVKTENQNLTPYMILDRVLVLFLANQPLSERWDILLRCALPFQYYNPYVESNVEICPEMFIGRREELEDVIKPGGANLIYGGRQLGKTALLHRARKLEDNRSIGKWSIYLEIKHCKSTEEAAMELYHKLQDEGFLKTDKCNSISWRDLSRKIIMRIKDESQPVSSFLLLIDEADNFLKHCGKVAYEPIDLLKRIQTDTENKFKFVLAGLHNVLRFNRRASQANSVLPQLSARTIKPLSFKEASELVEVPLSYLGFKMKPNQMALIAQILSSTNYYPGLIQFYASRLVKSLCQTNIGSVNDRPPYWLDENQILTLLKDSDFVKEINNKFLITLGIDSDEQGYYHMLATVITYCYFAYEENIENGYTAKMILNEGQSWGIKKMADLDESQITALLNELIELNILRNIASENELPRYIFNRASFRHILGDRDEVEESLLKLCEE